MVEVNSSARPRMHGRLAQFWIGAMLLAPLLIVALIPGLLSPYDPWANVGPPLLPPSLAHPFGTDDLGRDLFSAVLTGARTSLLVGIVVSVLALAIGTAMGIISGFLGGWWDDGLMRLTEIVQVVPRFFVAILIVGLFGASIEVLILVLGLTSWPGLARIARAQTLSLCGREFVRAAVALGGGPGWIMWRHILPNAAGTLIAALPVIASGAILTEAGLSYLGLSDPNTISWGRLIADAQPFIYRAWWLSVFPGLAIAVTILAITLVMLGWNRSELGRSPLLSSAAFRPRLRSRLGFVHRRA